MATKREILNGYRNGKKISDLTREFSLSEEKVRQVIRRYLSEEERRALAREKRRPNYRPPVKLCGDCKAWKPQAERDRETGQRMGRCQTYQTITARTDECRAGERPNADR